MKLYFILGSIVLLLSSCKPSLIETSKDKIQIFERNELKYFKGIHVRTLRNYKKADPIEMEITADSVFGNAIIQVHPDHIIFKNFPTSRDSIQLDLLATIDSLQVRGIHNSGDQTHLEFWYKDDYVYLFRRKPWLHQGSGEVTSVIGDWKFFTVKLRVDL